MKQFQTYSPKWWFRGDLSWDWIRKKKTPQKNTSKIDVYIWWDDFLFEDFCKSSSLPRSRGKLFVHLKSSSDFQIIRLSNVARCGCALSLSRSRWCPRCSTTPRGWSCFFSQSFPISGHHGGCFSGDALVMDYFLNDFVFVKTTLF